MIPTPDQFLAKLEASPADAAAFDRATRRERPHCTTRREAVEATLEAVRARQAENEILKQKIAATKTRLAALEAAKLSHSLMKTPSKPTTAPPAGTVTAAAFTKPQMTMARSEWSKLSTADKSRFFAEGGKLAEDPAPTKPMSKGGQLTREGLRQLTPRQQNEYFAKGNRLAE